MHEYGRQGRPVIQTGKVGPEIRASYDEVGTPLGDSSSNTETTIEKHACPIGLKIDYSNFRCVSPRYCPLNSNDSAS